MVTIINTATEQILITLFWFKKLGVVKLFWFKKLFLYLSVAKHGYTSVFKKGLFSVHKLDHFWSLVLYTW